MTPSGFTDSFNTESNTISISEGGNSCGFVNLNTVRFWSGGHNYTLNNPKLELYYLFAFLKKEEKLIMGLRVGSGLPNIQKNALVDVLIGEPSYCEQSKIGVFFKALDELIALHQRKQFLRFNLIRITNALLYLRPYFPILELCASMFFE